MVHSIHTVIAYILIILINMYCILYTRDHSAYSDAQTDFKVLHTQAGVAEITRLHLWIKNKPFLTCHSMKSTAAANYIKGIIFNFLAESLMERLTTLSFLCGKYEATASRQFNIKTGPRGKQLACLCPKVTKSLGGYGGLYAGLFLRWDQ